MEDYDEESREYYQDIKKTMETHKWNKDSEESPDGGNTGLNTLIEGWELKTQHHSTLLRNQPKDSWDSRRISNIEPLSYCMPWVDGRKIL